MPSRGRCWLLIRFSWTGWTSILQRLADRGWSSGVASAMMRRCLADRGYRVSAFDLSPAAIDWCHRRFAATTVKYQVADLFCLPASLRAQFDLTAEINTLQSLPPQQRTAAMAAIAQTVRSEGRVFVRCLARDDDEAVGSRPWPVSRAELQGFRTAGLHELEMRDDIPGRTGSRCFRAIYQRPPQEARPWIDPSS